MLPRVVLDAAVKGDIDAVIRFLDANVSNDNIVNARCTGCVGMTLLIGSAISGNKGLVTLLLQRQADIDMQDAESHSALMAAAEHGQSVVVAVLLKNGASTELRNSNDDETALMIACSSGHSAIVHMLLRAGAKADIRDAHGTTALELAAQRGHAAVLKLLCKCLSFGPDGTAVAVRALILAASQGHTKSVEALLLCTGLRADTCDSQGLSALQAARIEGHAACVELLQGSLEPTSESAASESGPPHPVVTRFIEQPSAPDEQVPCTTCKQKLQRASYSAKQWNARKRARGIRCRDCSSRMHRDLDAAEAMAAAGTSHRLASGVHIKPQNHGYCDYMDQLLRHDCFATLVQLRLFPSAKDCTESMGALYGVFGALSDYGNGPAGSAASEGPGNPADPAAPPGSPDIRATTQCGVLVLAIGDGTTPRTAALACYLTKWHAVSIDPLLEARWVGSSPQGVRRLTGVRGTLDDYVHSLPDLTTSTEDGKALVKLVLLCVHSHARFIGNSTISAIRARYGHVATTLVAIPCCASFHPDKDVGRRPGECCLFPFSWPVLLPRAFTPH